MKKILLLIFTMGICPVLFAGDGGTDRPLHWYIGVDGGAQVFDGMCDSRQSFGSRIAPVGGVVFGREMNNWLTLDLTASFAQFRGLYNRPIDEKHFTTDDVFDIDRKTYHQRGTYMQCWMRAGFDLNTIFAGYKAERRSSFVPYVGVGVATGLGACLEGVSNSGAALTLDYGLQYKYKTGKCVSLLLDFHGYGITKQLEGEVCEEHSMHSAYGLKIGVLFNLGARKK